MSDLLTPTVFLDIDGVVNSGRNYHEWNEAWNEGYKARAAAGLETDRWVDPAEDPYVLKLFDAENIAVLNQITSESGARIVVSSSWRMFYHSRFQKLRDILAAAGVKAEVVGPTPTSVPHRGLAIEGWLAANVPGQALNIVILDDESKHSFTPEIERWLVQTDGKKGLQPKDLARALKVIKGRKIHVNP
jgi:hypothetical protein